MYQLTEMIADNEYFSLREEYEDYFMVGNNILMDKDILDLYVDLDLEKYL